MSTLYILAVAGFAQLTVKSSLLKGWREKCSVKHFGNAPIKWVWWFLHNVFNCTLCMGLWAALLLLPCLYFQFYAPLYVFAAAGCAGLFDAIKRFFDTR